ncbi:type I-G CRISPR-associated protein, Cas3-extension family [Streptomyces sp. NBC_00459]|uniref:type I-G CRISPR-associated protein, Cas3-extension family n=1 Tax=Streptomyces sp. NBC_00459 TaxID=2975749 RepID=UPI002E19ABBE
MNAHQLELPALHSNDPLGFLAALGVLELADAALDEAVRLSWRGLAAPAVLHTDQPLTLNQLAELLVRFLPTAPAKEPLPAAPGILGLPRDTGPGAPNDALRMPIEQAHRLLRDFATAERLDNDPRARWFAALVNQLCVTPAKKLKDEPQQEHQGVTAAASSVPLQKHTLYTESTPLFAASGQMTLANNWVKAAEQCIRQGAHVSAALTGWIRVPDYTGANLDYRSTGDAAMTGDGKPSQQGVPGATWLALHAFATFRLTGNTMTSATTAWDSSGDLPALIWPVWTSPLSKTAIRALLEHPLVRADDPARFDESLTNLGLVGICSAHRTKLSNSYGPFEPGQVVWP